MNPEQAVQVLAALAAEQNLRGRALDAGRKALKSCADEERALGLPVLRGWSLEEIEFRFRSCSLAFAHGLLSYPFVTTHYDLCVKDTSGVWLDDLHQIGTYRLITLLNGESDDDYLTIDEDKPGESGEASTR